MMPIILCKGCIAITVFLSLACQLEAVQLPSEKASNGHAHEVAAIDSSGHSAQKHKWWVQVGDRVFHSPPSLLGLSQNISDYYYMMGSPSALTLEMRKHRVGGDGRWHIMHLPQNSSMLQGAPSMMSGDRRSAFSALKQFQRGQVLASSFPAYNMNPKYLHPLKPSMKELEMEAAKSVTPEVVNDYLKRLSQFPTRSYLNEEASQKVDKWLEKEFKKLGYAVCMQRFQAGGKNLVNVVAHVPGSHPGSMTVAAHYDSRPFEGRAPGAEDNGSGVATMLAIAKAFKKHIHRKPKKNVYFAAFAAEEPGLMGSKKFASFLTDGDWDMPDQCQPQMSFLQINKTKSEHHAVILDEIGWLSPRYTTPTVNLESYDTSKELMDHLRHAAMMHNGRKLEVQHNSAPFGSDHMSFLEKNMMAVLSINADDERYPHYHRNSDTMENVDPQYMSMIGKMNFGALLRTVL